MSISGSDKTWKESICVASSNYQICCSQRKPENSLTLNPFSSLWTICRQFLETTTRGHPCLYQGNFLLKQNNFVKNCIYKYI